MPVKSPIRYPGGKSAVAEYLVSLMPEGIREYRECMVGGGSIYLAARQANVAKTYWINDKFNWLSWFWRTCASPADCQRLHDDLMEVRTFLTSAEQIKSYYNSLRDEDPIDPYRRAFLFFFFNRVSFSGTTAAGGFSKNAAMKRFTVSSIERLLKLPPLLSHTAITCSDFGEVVSYPGSDSFVMIDPPYISAKKLYGNKGELHDFDHERLAVLLCNAEHKFLMTYDDDPRVRDLYRWANVETMDLQYSMVGAVDGKRRKGAELIISNYDLPRVR